MTLPQELIIEQPWLKVGCILGEGTLRGTDALAILNMRACVIGPVYDPSTSLLHFVDISENKVMSSSCTFMFIAVHRLLHIQVFHVNTQDLQVSVEKFDESISCLALRRDAEGVSGQMICEQLIF